MKIRSTALALGLGLSSLAFAQVDPAGVQQRFDRDRLDRLKRDQQLNKPAPAQPSISLPGEKPTGEVSDVKNIPVTRFEVDASAVLSADEIESVLAPYRGTTVSLKDLFAAIASLNKLYDAKGAKTSRAILPAQDVKDGVVKIRLVEARLGGISISGDKWLKKSFVMDRIHQKPGDLLSVDQLEQDLVRFNSLHDAKLRANLAAGAEAGKTDLSLEVQEPPRYSLTTYFNNSGSYSTGLGRGGVVIGVNGLTGYGDNLMLTASGTDGSRSYGISYSIPVNSDDLRLDLSYSRGTLDVVNGSFAPLDISGRSHDTTVGLTQPFAVSLNRQFATYGRVSWRNSLTQFSGITQQEQNLTVIATGLSGEAHYDDVSWTLDNSLNFGAKTFGGDASFTYYRLNASRIDSLSERFSLVTRLGAQYSFDDQLPSSEQFQAGGLYSVRGYSEALLTGRHGYAVSAELRALVYSPPPEQGAGMRPQVQVMTFVDHGAAFPYGYSQGTNIDHYLTSAGTGLMLDFGTRVSARVAVAWALDKNPAETRQIHPAVLAGLKISWL
jgi:hemolysin activation/secretion protein